MKRISVRIMRAFAVLTLFGLILYYPFAKAACRPGEVNGSVWNFRSFRTGYFPHSSRMEGGFVDRKKKPLRTLQAYIAGRGDYVSVAMDHTFRRLPYGTKLRIPEIEKHFGKCILFKVVDTGGRFKRRGTAKIDICNDSRRNTHAEFSNGFAKVYVMPASWHPRSDSPARSNGKRGKVEVEEPDDDDESDSRRPQVRKKRSGHDDRGDRASSRGRNQRSKDDDDDGDSDSEETDRRSGQKRGRERNLWNLQHEDSEEIEMSDSRFSRLPWEFSEQEESKVQAEKD